MLADVLHFSFTVSNLERSIDWYTRVLGLELVARQRQENDYTKVLVGFPNAVLEVAQFKLPSVNPPYSTHMLELIEYVSGAEHCAVDLKTSMVGVPHLALIVTDIHEKYKQMLSDGTTFRNPPVEITEGVNVGGFACYLVDPDRITLELLQFSPERAARLGIASGSR